VRAASNALATTDGSVPDAWACQAVQRVPSVWSHAPAFPVNVPLVAARALGGQCRRGAIRMSLHSQRSHALPLASTLSTQRARSPALPPHIDQRVRKYDRDLWFAHYTQAAEISADLRMPMVVSPVLVSVMSSYTGVFFPRIQHRRLQRICASLVTSCAPVQLLGPARPCVLGPAQT